MLVNHDEQTPRRAPTLTTTHQIKWSREGEAGDRYTFINDFTIVAYMESEAYFVYRQIDGDEVRIGPMVETLDDALAIIAKEERA